MGIDGKADGHSSSSWREIAAELAGKQNPRRAVDLARKLVLLLDDEMKQEEDSLDPQQLSPNKQKRPDIL